MHPIRSTAASGPRSRIDEYARSGPPRRRPGWGTWPPNLSAVFSATPLDGMLRFLVRRVVLALVTLWLLSVIVFLASHALPGDVGRKILGPFADPRSVATLDHSLGVDRPLLAQYLTWVGGLLHADLGTSLSF